jgi:DNA-binding CsgD family transcriptional regulator
VNSIRQLSIREVEILDRIVRGDSNKHIARHFDIAEATVKAHVKAILRKIGVANRTQAAIWAVNNAMPEKNGSEPANDVEFTVAVPERETALPIFRERGPGQTIQIY